jgi:hypothetical protein
MKLPNAENAVIDIEKLHGYCLNPTHRKGKHKARLFVRRLGLERYDAERLRQALHEAILKVDAIEQKRSAHGRRFIVNFGAGHGSGLIWYETLIRSAWIVRNNEDFPRLVSCYPN